MKRKLDDNFIENLKTGILSPILKRIKNDDTLMLFIRENYINIYYRGGNILKITQTTQNIYTAFFDTNYNKHKKELPKLAKKIKAKQDSEYWVEAIPKLKEIMDFYFVKHPKQEREFQQLIARENNYSTISNEAEYFITDIEFDNGSKSGCCDMLAIKWKGRNDRKNTKNCSIALIELKYGDNALDGNAGIISHIKNMTKSIKKEYDIILETCESQFNQLDELGLIKFNKSQAIDKIKLSKDNNPEIIFLFANHNPSKPKLKEILSSKEFNNNIDKKFDIKFNVSSFGGYALYNKNMHTLEEFKKLI